MEWRQFITMETKSGKYVMVNSEIKYFELADDFITIIKLDGSRRFYNLNHFNIIRISQTQ